MADKVIVHSGGIGLGGLLFAIFLVLKLLGVIGWSWWWVTAPLWIPAGLSLAFVVGALLIGLLATLLMACLKPRRRK
jgi:hypothetical protein